MGCACSCRDTSAVYRHSMQDGPGAQLDARVFASKVGPCLCGFAHGRTTDPSASDRLPKDRRLKNLSLSERLIKYFTEAAPPGLSF